MSEYNPSKKDLAKFRSIALGEFVKLSNAEADNTALSTLRAALRFFMQAGAIKKSWLEKIDMAAELGIPLETVDDQVRELLTSHVGENGDTENLVQTLQRIINERDNVKRNRERT